MKYRDRTLFGFLLILVSIAVLYWGSPMRTGSSTQEPVYAYTFIGLFALGFSIFTMGVLGHEDAYTAFISGFVLYVLVGFVITLILYITNNGIHQYALEDVGSSAFWNEFGRLTITWPLRLVQLSGFLGWTAAEGL